MSRPRQANWQRLEPLAERNTQIAVQEHKIAALAHEKEERDKLIEHLRTDLAALRLAAAAAAERSSGDLEHQAHGGPGTRAERAEGEFEKSRKQLQEVEAELATTVETLRAEKAAAAGSLEEVRAERRALEHELDQLRRSLQSKDAETPSENEELRRAIEDVATQIMASVAGTEGGGRGWRPCPTGAPQGPPRRCRATPDRPAPDIRKGKKPAESRFYDCGICMAADQDIRFCEPASASQG